MVEPEVMIDGWWGRDPDGDVGLMMIRITVTLSLSLSQDAIVIKCIPFSVVKETNVGSVDDIGKLLWHMGVQV